MNWISVLICCVTLRTRGVCIMGSTRKRAHIPISVLSQDLGKEEWDIRGKMLFSNVIIPTTEFHESTTCSSIEDDEGSEETPPSLLIATTQKMCCEAYVSVKNQTISKSRKKSIHPQIISKSRKKNSHKNQRMKRSISFLEPINNVNKKEEIDFNKRSEQQIVDTSEINSNYSSRIYQYTEDQNNVNSELSPIQDKSNMSSNNIIMPKENNVEKRKRENGLTKTDTNFNMDNYWETPTCQIIGDGANHVCVQYSSPPLLNSIKPKLNSSNAKNQNEELQNKNIDNSNESIEPLPNEPLQKMSNSDDQNYPPAYNKHISGDIKCKSQIIKNPFNAIQKLDSGSTNGNHDILHGEKNDFFFGSNDDISKYQNNMMEQDWNKINDHWINFKKNPETKERISDYIPDKIQSNIKPADKRRRGIHLPIDITVAMKNLFTQLNPMDVNVTNSSYISPEGSFEFNIQLRDKAAQLKNPI